MNFKEFYLEEQVIENLSSLLHLTEMFEWKKKELSREEFPKYGYYKVKELVSPSDSPKDEFVAEKIPISSISGVWYILPILVGEGILELVYKNGEIERGSAFPPTEKHIIVPKEGIALKQ